MSLAVKRTLLWTIFALVQGFGLANANICYYPDGRTISTTDIPCNNSAAASSCCNSDAFCLIGGLCFGGGIVSRGSCTDATWESEACAQVCTTVSTSENVAVTPCSNNIGPEAVNTFVCGVNTTGCHSGRGTFGIAEDLSILLRPAQVAALLEQQLAAQPQPDTGFGAGALAGVAVGVAIPLVVVLVVVIIMLRKERRRARTIPALRQEAMTPQPVEPKFDSPGHSSNLPIPTGGTPSPLLSAPSLASSGIRSRASSLRSPLSVISRFPSGTFADRYSVMRQNARNEDALRHEMDSTPTVVHRFELAEKRMS